MCRSGHRFAAHFNLVHKAPSPLGFLAYNGPMIGRLVQYGILGQAAIPDGIEGSSPIVLFTHDLSTSMVLSSARCVCKFVRDRKDESE